MRELPRQLSVGELAELFEGRTRLVELLAERAPPENVDAVLAALAGFFVQRATLLPPPGLPTLREFQRAQGTESLAWLRRRLES